MLMIRAEGLSSFKKFVQLQSVDMLPRVAKLGYV